MILVLQIFLSLLSVIAAGIILITPSLSNYYLQFFALTILGFAFFHRLTKKKTIDYKMIVEQKQLNLSLQLFFIAFGLILLIGSTGSFSSPLFPLIFIYFFFLLLANHWLTSLFSAGAILGVFYYLMPNFGQAHYGAVISILVFLPIAFFAQKYYRRFLADREELALEREKISYYNLYAEKQQAELLTHQSPKKNNPLSKKQQTVNDFLQTLIPQIDQLQTESRFPQNQLIVSSKLTKLALVVRRFLHQLNS